MGRIVKLVEGCQAYTCNVNARRWEMSQTRHLVGSQMGTFRLGGVACQEGVPAVLEGALGGDVRSETMLVVAHLGGAPPEARTEAEAIDLVTALDVVLEAQAAVIAHLEGVRPFGISLTCTPGSTGDGFRGNSRRGRVSP